MRGTGTLVPSPENHWCGLFFEHQLKELLKTNGILASLGMKGLAAAESSLKTIVFLFLFFEHQYKTLSKTHGFLAF